jgi:hypothetical protein
MILLAVHVHRAARVLVLTDEKFRKKMQFVLDTRVQAGAYAGMVLQMLIVPGTALTKQHDVLLLDTTRYFVTARGTTCARNCSAVSRV